MSKIVLAGLVFAGLGGIPKVIGWASTDGTSGIAWGSTAAVSSGNAYITYDGALMRLNVPSGKTFSFSVADVPGFAGFRLANEGARPDCAEAIRGRVRFETRGALAADSLAICRKNTLDLYEWLEL